MNNKSFDEDKIIDIIVIPVAVVLALLVWWLIKEARIEPTEPEETTIYYGEFIGDSIDEKSTEQVVEISVKNVQNTETTEPQYIEKEMIITAYCPCEKCCGVYALNRPKDENGKDIVYTSSGKIAKSGKTIAVDPSVIPYGSKVIIEGVTYIAEDCGGAIKGNRIDVYFDEHQKALDFVYPHGKIVKKVKVIL